MSVVFLLVGLMAAAVAALVPFRMGLTALILLLPFSNVYAFAVAVLVLLARWLATDARERQMNVARAQGVLLICAVVFMAVFESAFTSDDLLRLGTETSQWALALGLLAITVLSLDGNLEKSIVRSFAVSGVVLGIVQIAGTAAGLQTPEEDVTPFFMVGESNYTALFAMFALVALPLSLPEYVGGRRNLMLLVSSGFLVIFLNESRAQLAVALLLLFIYLLCRIARTWVFVLLSLVVPGLVAVAGLVTVQQGLYNPQSLGSLFNFDTNYSNLERLGLLLHAVELFLANPIGYGIGSSSDLFLNSPYTVGSYPTPHNTLAMLIVEWGVLGLAAYLLLMGYLLTKAIGFYARRDTRAILPVALFASTVLDAVFFNGSVAILFWLAFALLWATPANQSLNCRIVVEGLSQHGVRSQGPTMAGG
jgi:O-antigen ligase